MNVRDPIQRTRQPPVLSLSFSASRNRFAAGLSDGLRTFRSDNCLVANELALPSDCGASVVSILDDRYLAYVSHRRGGDSTGPNTVVFWDSLFGKVVQKFDFHEPVLGIRLTSLWMVVILMERAVVFQYQEMRPQALPTPPLEDTEDDDLRASADDRPLRLPNSIYALYPTARNPFAVASLSNDMLVLPSTTQGQIQLISLNPSRTGNKRVLLVHKTSLRFMALSDDSSLLATSSEQGTLVRVWNTKTHAPVAEFRRGLDAAAIYGLAFSPKNRWLACTSDKGTLHVFDLQPPSIESTATVSRESKGRQRTSSYAAHRLSGNSFEKDSSSGMSAGRSSPSRAPSTAVGTGYHGSVQEYYGLRPPPSSASPPTGQASSAMAALRASPFAPKIISDTRSVASAPFYMGDDPPHWQGGLAHSWTVAPNGTRKRISHPVLPLPNDPAGRPPKGTLAFAPSAVDTSDDDGAVLYVVGGASDARWEMFDLLPAIGDDAVHRWVLRNGGYRKYLTRQFAD